MHRRVTALPRDCTIHEAENLKALLLELMDDPGLVSIDIQAVERIDTPTLQLLATFVLDRSAHGRGVAWFGTSRVFLDTARRLGLDSALGLERLI